MKAKLRTMLLSCLALLLVLGMTSVVCAYDVSFSDVPEDSWFYTDVMTLAESGVIGGYPDGTYRPTKKVTTGEALKMILLAAGYPEPEPAASHWARGYLNFAIEQGFLTRYEDISDLDVNMTRGLVAKLAANALGLSDPGTYGTFTDTGSFLGFDRRNAAAAKAQVIIVQNSLPVDARVRAAVSHLVQIDIAAVGKIQWLFHHHSSSSSSAPISLNTRMSAAARSSVLPSGSSQGCSVMRRIVFCI